ncbi:hypothetical protein GQ43DRAFT_496494 [Delitschia confertaspora ATCC 74209]|uniref:Uncharacterized protein n=1 Tax=Delitschia confertaspora ATCC 74209 TaxID=1513339 RepID=A0A9P4JTD1_9PLEO|nr:hypothetical protein GQ43DRAFT_496494 [Delitschia confertaspora ATCC 74209]
MSTTYTPGSFQGVCHLRPDGQNILQWVHEIRIFADSTHSSAVLYGQKDCPPYPNFRPLHPMPEPLYGVLSQEQVAKYQEDVNNINQLNNGIAAKYRADHEAYCLWRTKEKGLKEVIFKTVTFNEARWQAVRRVGPAWKIYEFIVRFYQMQRVLYNATPAVGGASNSGAGFGATSDMSREGPMTGILPAVHSSQVNSQEVAQIRQQLWPSQQHATDSQIGSHLVRSRLQRQKMAGDQMAGNHLSGIHIRTTQMMENPMLENQLCEPQISENWMQRHQISWNQTPETQMLRISMPENQGPGYQMHENQRLEYQIQRNQGNQMAGNTIPLNLMNDLPPPWRH